MPARKRGHYGFDSRLRLYTKRERNVTNGESCDSVFYSKGSPRRVP